MVVALVYYSVNPLTSRVFKLSYSYIIVDISFILVLHLPLLASFNLIDNNFL